MHTSGHLWRHIPCNQLAEMDAAREQLSAEVEVGRGAMGHSSYGQEEYLEAWGVVIADMVFDDKVGGRGW